MEEKTIGSFGNENGFPRFDIIHKKSSRMLARLADGLRLETTFHLAMIRPDDLLGSPAPLVTDSAHEVGIIHLADRKSIS